MANIKKIEEILTTSIFEVLEKMFFVFAEPSRGGVRTYRLRTMIRFEGPCTGEMQLFFTPGLAKTMAVNMLNLEEEEITDGIMVDCVKESINMICGNFLRKLDPVHGSRMTIPVCDVISDQEELHKDQNPARVKLAFVTETEAFEVRLDVQDHPQL